MNATTANPPRGSLMDILVLLALLALWVVLQVWLLPRLGVRT
jgi:hypothetical protein